MKTKLLIVLVCLFICIPASQSQCVTVPNQNTVYGTVFSDSNQNGSQGFLESGVNNVTVNLYKDNNGNGNIDAGDAIVTSATSNGSGDYTIVIPQTTTTNNVADYFNSTSYSNNNGSENWSNSWQEKGESDGTGDGNIRVNNGKLRFGDDDGDNKTMTGDGVDRIVNLSTYTSATLSFVFSRESDHPVKGRDWSVNVQVSSNGSTYTTLDNFSFNDTQQAYSYTIPSSLISATTHIRFVGSGYREKEENYLLFDNVNVSYTKTDVAFPNYIVSMDTSTTPNGSNLTTASKYSVAFTAFGQMDCDNDFGLYLCGPLCNPLAEDDHAEVDQGESITIAVLDNDSDGDDNIEIESLFIITEPTNGSVSIDDSGKVIYSPNGSYVGNDSFVYEICDTTPITPLCDTATVYITVNENVVDPCFQAVQEQTYFIPFPDNNLRTALGNADSGSCSENLTNNVNRVISLKSPYPGSIITYDHWEDGYEVDIKNPTQSTTQVWGDKDITNGTSPEYDDDYIPSGGDIVLENTYNYNPRNASQIVYDGKDKIYSSNDISISVIAGDVNRFDIQLAKTDVYNLNKFGTAFTIPFGEDLGQEFQYTSLFIRASQNNTEVNVDLDNDGDIDNTDTLNEGEVMFIDGGVDSGARVTSDKPVGVDLFFGAKDCFGTRQINILPGKFHGDTYYSPVPTTNSAAPSVVYFFNSLNRSININWQSNSSSGTLTVPAKSSSKLSLSVNSGYKFKSQGGESYVASQVIDSDSNGSAYDWAFNLIAENRLTDFASIAWAPGNLDYSANYNPVWVTPTANTTLYIKYDGDLGDASASVSPCGIPYDQSITLNALNYAKIFDTFNNDNDQSGLSVFTCDGTKIFALYGQDASLAPPGVGSLDVGTTMQPMCLNPLVFANDDLAYGLAETPITIPVSSNDTAFLTNLGLNSITNTGLLQPQNGFITVHANGTITYTPNDGFIGVDTFEYSICSAEFPGVCDTALVTINIALCATPTNKNIVYGQVYIDLNEDTINNDGIGVEGADVKIYNDTNNNGTVDSGDVLLSTVTTNSEGYYDFEAPNYNVVIKDDFSSSNYSGGTGWSTNWIEVSDDNNPLSGDVKIEGSRKWLLIKNDSKIYRSANLSGVTNANISFTVREFGGLESSDDVLIQVCSNNSFSNCQTLFIKADDFASETVNGLEIDADKLTSTTTFRVTTNGYTSSNERLYIDNIKIRYQVNVENLVMETDLSSLPTGYNLSTDNVEVANFLPGTFGNCEKSNDFGFLRCNLTESNLEFLCNDNGTPLDVTDDFYNITMNPDGTRLGATYTITGDITGTGTYGTPQTFGPFPVSSGNKLITITDSSANCSIEDIEISVTNYSCLDLNDDYTIDFDGVDDYLSTDSFINGLNEVTIMAWVKRGAPNGSYWTIAGEDTGCKLLLNNGYTPTFTIKGSGIAAKSLVSPHFISENEWHHITGAYSSVTGLMRLYIDGVQVNSFSVAAGSAIENTANSNGKFEVGRLSSNVANKEYFKGNIDEVRVFNTALTQDQIQQLVYQEIQDNFGKVKGAITPKDIKDRTTNTTIDWSSLVAYYPMTIIKNSTTSDFSENSKALTLYNITTVQEQTAPMPYQTKADGLWTTEATWLHGDVWDIEDTSKNKAWSIVKISNEVSASHSIKTLGLIIDANHTFRVHGEMPLENSWYLELNGTLNLEDDCQLLQTQHSDLVTSSTGKILRRQEGTSNKYRYNYWSSPVGTLGVTNLTDNNTASNNANNSPFTLNMLKNEIGADIPFTSSYDQLGKISTYWLYTYKNALTYWDWVFHAPTTPLQAGVGYTQKGTGNAGTEQQYIFEGKPNNGTILVSVTDRGGAGSVPNVSKTEYLLGNPYPSALDIHKFIDDNVGVIDGWLQLWQQWGGNSHYLSEYEGGYAQVNKTGSVRAYQFVGFYGATNGSLDGTKTPSRYLPVGQGFIAEIVGSGTVEFNNSQRVFIKESDANGTYNNGSSFFKSSNEKSKNSISKENSNLMQKIRLEFSSVSGPATRRELLLGFSQSTSDGFDYGFDAECTESNNNDFNLNLEGKNMNIQAYSSITDDKVVPLNFKSSGDNSFEIKISEMEDLEEGRKVYLKDHLTGGYFELTTMNAYRFSSKAGKFNKRFELVFQSESQTLGMEASNYAENFIYYLSSSNTLFAKKLSASVSRLALISMRGQTVMELKDVSPETLNNGLKIVDVATGAYVACFRTDDNQVITKKIIVN